MCVCVCITGIKTPAWATAYAVEDVEAAVELGGLEFPMLVKHHNIYSSIGLTRDSKVKKETYKSCKRDLQ